MKKEFTAKREKLTEAWPGEFAAFSWQDFVTAIPSPLFLITTHKSNGKETLVYNLGQPSSATVALKATHICMDSDHYNENKLGRYGKTGYMYNINSPRNPDTGEMTPECFGA